MQEEILIVDFGSQYTQLIARKVRELNVFCEIYPFNKLPEIGENIKGIILSGSPYSVWDEDAPTIDLEGIRGRIPILGVCYGAQRLVTDDGGKVEKSKIREYGKADLVYIDDVSLFDGFDNPQVWMSHADTIVDIPSDYQIICSTGSVIAGGFKVGEEETYGLQFHPEVFHSIDGKILLGNFVNGICGMKADWTPDSYIETTVAALKKQIGDDQVILGLSGGVDSTVAAALLHKAIGDQMTGIFVNNGLLRKNEFEEVLENYKQLGYNVIGVDASERFYQALEGITDPEAKRKAIGNTFIEVFDDESHKIENAKWLGQGTIYPDVIESESVKGPSQTIKSHHNVGGLPDYMKLKLVEPLRMLFKDEVRRIGKELGLSEAFLGRHPFPGPGLGIRILGNITKEKVQILQDADAIFIQGLRDWNLYDKVWQAGTILLPVNTVGVMGDERTYERVVSLRAVSSTDGMTAEFVHLPYDFLQKISGDIINQVKGINRVVYDISSKPPATIEWE
jgi:GMP synthase (glutamine-hydrolysing)